MAKKRKPREWPPSPEEKLRGKTWDAITASPSYQRLRARARDAFQHLDWTRANKRPAAEVTAAEKRLARAHARVFRFEDAAFKRAGISPTGYRVTP